MADLFLLERKQSLGARQQLAEGEYSWAWADQNIDANLLVRECDAVLLPFALTTCRRTELLVSKRCRAVANVSANRQ